MSALLEEAKYFGKLEDFTPTQRSQMGHWLEHSYDSGIGVIQSCRAVVSRADQGSMYYMVDRIIRALITEGTGLDSGRSFEERVAVALLQGGKSPCAKLDGDFMRYGDGSLMVGMEHTGFVVAHDDDSLVIHPATRFSIQLQERSYDLSYGQKTAVTGRTLFFYHLVQACRAILAAEESSREGGAA